MASIRTWKSLSAIRFQEAILIRSGGVIPMRRSAPPRRSAKLVPSTSAWESAWQSHCTVRRGGDDCAATCLDSGGDSRLENGGFDMKATQLLKKDHDALKKLFADFLGTADRTEKKRE